MPFLYFRTSDQNLKVGYCSDKTEIHSSKDKDAPLLVKAFLPQYVQYRSGDLMCIPSSNYVYCFQ